MASILSAAGVYEVLLLCITSTIVSFNLQGCGANGSLGQGQLGQDPQARAQAMLNTLHEDCSARCTDKCTYKAQDLVGHTKEAIECTKCLHETCKEDFLKLQSQFAQHWQEPVCQQAIGDAAVCWTDVGECTKQDYACFTTKTCDFSKIGQCWHDYTKKCLDKYLPCCYSNGNSEGSSGGQNMSR